jgi:hypothetical protein
MKCSIQSTNPIARNVKLIVMYGRPWLTEGMLFLAYFLEQKEN